jgi:uncharacterized protein (DUF169 family)
MPDLAAMSQRFTEVLGLTTHPMALVYSDVAVAEEPRVSVCGAFCAVGRHGLALTMSAKNSLCPGGSYYLGFTERRPGLEEFLVREERIFESFPVCRRAIDQMARPPRDLRPYVNLVPLAQATFQPDLVIFTANGEQASRLLGLVAYVKGVWEMGSFGATCYSAVTVPVMRGRTEVSFIDISARRSNKDYAASDVLVSMPWLDFEQAHRVMDDSICGTYTYTVRAGEV